MQKKVLVLALLLAVTVGLIVRCAKQNRPPQIASISGPDSIQADGNCALTCNASDPDGDSLTYAWTCERGHCTPATGRTVNWYAPDTSGNVIIIATVQDPHGATDQSTKMISVTRVTTTHLDTNGIYIPAGSSQAFYLTCKVGHTASGSFSVPQYGITFMVLDSSNYDKWVNNQTYTYLVQYYKSAGSSYSVVIPATQCYYFLLDNTFSILTPKYASLSIYTTTP
jgi:hypothetical protein